MSDVERSGPVADITQEARRLVDEATDEGLVVRLLGGLAVRLHARDPHPVLDRTFNDIDLAAPAGAGRRTAEFIESMGYAPDDSFNTVNAGRRGLFYDPHNERQLDLFIAEFAMCHTLDLGERLEIDPLTVPLADLVLTKLQIVELNEKDQRDVLALIVSHEIGDADDDMINAGHIAALCAADWGLWRTSTRNIERIDASVDMYGLSADEQSRIRSRLETLRARIEQEPKTRRWKLRDRVGERVRWYEEPDEIG